MAATPGTMSPGLLAPAEDKPIEIDLRTSIRAGRFGPAASGAHGDVIFVKEGGQVVRRWMGGGSEALSVEAGHDAYAGDRKAGGLHSPPAGFRYAFAGGLKRRGSATTPVNVNALARRIRRKTSISSRATRSRRREPAEGWSLGSLQRADLDHSVLDRRRRRRILREE